MPTGVYPRTAKHRASIRAARLGNQLALKHGHGRRNGRSSPAYMTWRDMIQRCTNPNRKGYKNYGGRGIKICIRWLKFENFLADMGEKPDGLSIDRIDNDGDYEPGNCRWATRLEQARNKSRHCPGCVCVRGAGYE